MPSKPKVFRSQSQSAPEQAAADYERHRGSARDRGYGPRWDRASRLFRLLHPLCLGCEAIDLIEPTTVTDHVVPHRGDMAVFWNESDWQPSCDWHHSVVKQKLEALFDQGKIDKASLWLNSPKAIEITLELKG